MDRSIIHCTIYIHEKRFNDTHSLLIFLLSVVFFALLLRFLLEDRLQHFVNPLDLLAELEEVLFPHFERQLLVVVLVLVFVGLLHLELSAVSYPDI